MSGRERGLRMQSQGRCECMQFSVQGRRRNPHRKFRNYPRKRETCHPGEGLFGRALSLHACGFAASAPRAMPRRKNVTQPPRPRREWHFASLAWRAPLRRHSCSINIGSFLCGRWRPTHQIGKLIMATVPFFTSRAIAARSPPAFQQFCSPSSEDGRAPCWARLWSSTGVAR